MAVFTFVTNKETTRVGMSLEDREVFSTWENGYRISGNNKIWTIKKTLTTTGKKILILWQVMMSNSIKVKE